MCGEGYLWRWVVAMGLGQSPISKGGRVMGSFVGTSNTATPGVCVCVCVCVLGARAVVALRVRTRFCLLPWDLWVLEWTGGVGRNPLARGGCSIYCFLWWNQGTGRWMRVGKKTRMGMESGGGGDKGLLPALPALPEAERRVAG